MLLLAVVAATLRVSAFEKPSNACSIAPIFLPNASALPSVLRFAHSSPFNSAAIAIAHSSPFNSAAIILPDAPSDSRTYITTDSTTNHVSDGAADRYSHAQTNKASEFSSTSNAQTKHPAYLFKTTISTYNSSFSAAAIPTVEEADNASI
jgi:hypothetical protein